MNSLNINIPAGSIVKTKDDGKEYVCLSGFGLRSNLVGAAIMVYPRGKRRWMKIVHVITTYDDEGRLASIKNISKKILKTTSISGIDIQRIIRKGWRKR